MTYYAWTNFDAELNEHGQATRTIKPGEKISQGDIGVNDADWQELIDAGAVREARYPENLPPHVSPAEHERSKIVPKTGTAGELMLPKQHEGETQAPVEEATEPPAVEEEGTGSILDRALGLG